MRYNLVTVVWGEEHTGLFVDLCLPNLLISGNLGALCNTPNPVFRIFTTPKDALKIESSPAFRKASEIIDFKISMISDEDFAQKYTLASKYFQKGTDLAAEDNAAAIVIGPECLLSEGYISNVLRIAESGKRVIMVSQIRVAKETFLPQLLKESSVNSACGPVMPRKLVKLALENMHPVSKSLLWSSNKFHKAPGHIYFEVPEEGILARCFHLSPVLVNSVCKNAGSSKVFDGDYILNACPDINDIYISSDSDELMSVEVTSLSYPNNAGKGPSNPLNIAAFAKYFTCGHNRIFIRSKIRLHFDDISTRWEKVEQLSDKAIDRIFYWLKFEPLLIWPYGMLLKAKKFARDTVKLFLGEFATRELSARVRLICMKTSLFMEKFLQRIEFDRSVFFGLMARISNIITGPVAALLITIKFTPQIQGYYYTFWNILALQVLIELGLGTVITQFASHEWSGLSMDRDGYVIGQSDALSRISSLARFTLRWFIAGGTIMTIGLGAGGYFFFSHSGHNGAAWVLPWIALSTITGMNVLFVPIWSLLEGCNQVASLYKYRFLQGLCTSSSVCILILAGAGLWTASISALVTFMCACLFLRFRYRNFLKSLFRINTPGLRIEWKKEILPMQWRVAISSISGYFTFSLFTPVLFKYHGPVVAGQMGMSLGIIGFVTSLPGSWLIPKTPRFGVLIARKDYAELDRIFFRTAKIFIMLLTALAFLVWCLIYLLNMLKSPIAGRLLGPLPMALLLLAQVIPMTSLPFSVYLRAHKKEPILYPAIISGTLVGISAIILGKAYSVMGIAIGYLLVTSLVTPLVIIIWYRCRTEWHADGAG